MQSRRRGLSSVFGFIVIFMLLMAGLAAISTGLSVQYSVWNAQQQARQIQNNRQLEHLALSLNGSDLVVSNEGLVPSQLQYLIQKVNGSTTDSRIGGQLQAGASSAIPVPSPLAGYAVVTSLGNVFWLQDAPGIGATTVPITFDASGLSPSLNSSVVLTLDGQPVTYSQLPKTYEWQAGSSHTFSYTAGFSVGPSQRIGWVSSRGLSLSMQGTVVASQPGSIVSQYEDQYLLTVIGGGGVSYLGSSADDGWYSAGSTALVSTPTSWNVTAGDSRQNLVSWNVDGTSDTAVARSGGGTFVAPGIVMDAPHILYLNSVTQYYVSASTNVPASGSLPPLSVSYSYEGPASSPWSCAAFSVSSSSGNTATEYPCPEPSASQTVTSISWTDSVTQTGPSGDSLGFWVSLNGCNSSTYGATSGSSGSFSGCMPETGAPILIQWAESPGCESMLKKGGEQPVYCGTTFTVASSGTYTYISSFSGSSSTASSSFSLAGASVAYTYDFGYSFPAGSTSTALTVSYPPSESLASFSSPCGTWTASANTITITGACSLQYVLSTSFAGSYSVSLGASPTGDGWYDAGSSVTLSATSSGPFSFFGWGLSGAAIEVGSGTDPSTTVVPDSPGTVTAVFNVVE